MPFYDEQGNEVEGLLTQEDLDTKLEEEKSALTEKYEAEKAQALERVGAIEAEKKALEEKIKTAQGQGDGDGGSSDKDTNLANLRKKLEETTTALDAERNANKEKFSSIENDKIDQEIRAIAGDDEELAKKIRYNYDNVLTGFKASTNDQIKEKVANATKLSVVNLSGPDPISVAINGGSRGAPAGGRTGDNKGFRPNEVAIGQKLGISDQDRAKYGNDPRLNNNK
jgi:seryl-tRNA synthetase